MARKQSVKVNCSYCGKPKMVWNSVYEASMKSHGLFFCNSNCCNDYRRDGNNPWLGRKHTEKALKQMSDSKKGVPTGRSWNKGLTKSTDSRVMATSQKLKGKTAWNKGKKHLGGSNNPMYGVEPWNKGKPLPSWVRAVISNGNKKAFENPEIHAKYCGENNVFWRGGIASTPYGPEFSGTLKRLIKERDEYCCRVCGEHESDALFNHSVHHIDYNKADSKEENLATLCASCHSKTNFNRDEWEAYLTGVVRSGFRMNRVLYSQYGHSLAQVTNYNK